MDTKNFKDRSALRGYFLKNKIPTEANFADLVNSTLNQVEDGIFKPIGDPLSLVAAGDATSPQKLLNFYGNASDANPSWTLQMRPRADQNDPATAKAGFSVSDGDGRSRLFVDAGSGYLGVGTVTPDRNLTVAATSGASYLNVKDGTHEILMGVDAMGGIVSVMSNHDLLFRAGVNSEKMRITAGGNVGIGVSAPAGKLDVANLVRLGLDEGGSGPKSISFSRDGGDEGNAGKITYKGSFGASSLNIVGAGAVPRKIKMYDNVEVAGALTPSAGNGETRGILFPKDPGGGAADAAWIRYYPRSGESCTLELGVSNDADDHIALMPSGCLGIGTTAPSHKFHVVGVDAVGLFESTGTQAYVRLISAEGMNNRVEITNRPGGRLSLWTAGGGDAFNVTREGKVGIGTITPNSALSVNGSIGGGETNTGWVLGRGAWGQDNWLRLTTSQNGSTYHDLAINSLWSAGQKRFDLAEVTPVNEGDRLEQGDVVVIDPDLGLRVTRCRKPGDTSVYGIVSSYEQAALVIGGVGGPEAARHDRANLPVAMVGRVAVKVSAENGAIRPGDLLTTSATPGHAMRCDDRARYAGAIVGKALEPLADGTGIIKMLVAMQ